MTQKQLKLQESRNQLWDYNLAALASFLSTHSISDISIKSTQIVDKKVIKVGTWFYQQRKLYNKKLLTDNRKLKLENTINGIFKSTYYNWEKSFRSYITTIKKGIQINYSTTVGKDNYKLGQWVKNQKKFYKNSDPQLTPKQIKKIEKVNSNFFDGIQKV